VGPLTVVMETLPLSQASRTAAIAPRHGLAHLSSPVPRQLCDDDVTHGAKSGS